MSTESAELERLRAENKNLLQQFAELEEEAAKLRGESNDRNNEDQINFGLAVSSELGLFLLKKIGEEGEIPISELGAKLTGLEYWLAIFGLFMRAQLVDKVGESIVITPRGRKVLAEIGVVLKE